MSFIYALLAGAVAGILFYLAVCYRRRAEPALAPILECGLSGSGLIAGIHLTYCAFIPRDLVHFTQAGAPFLLPPGVTVEMDPVHTIHIFLGGIATIFLSVAAIWKFSREHRSRGGESIGTE